MSKKQIKIGLAPLLTWGALALTQLTLADTFQGTQTPTVTKGQHIDSVGDGVRFEQDLSWPELLAKAKAENKMLVVDCYTTWCAPCKHLDANVFPTKVVGDFFNEHFISYKIQMDRTKADSPYTIARYELADSLRITHQVLTFPTFLFFDAEGQLVHKVVGAGDPIPDFLGRISEALNPATQYYTIMRNFEAGDRKDIARVKELADLAFEKRDVERQRALSGRYFELLDGQVNADIISFAEKFCTSSSMPAFDWFIKHEKEVDAIRHKGHAASEVIEILLGEIYYKGGYSSYEDVDWKAYKKEIDSKYPKYSKPLLALTKAAHFTGGKNPKQFGKNVKKYMRKYGHTADVENLHSFAWEVFRHPELHKSLGKDALAWMDRVLAADDNYLLRQTQACLLYINGHTEEAIRIQEKATNDAHEFRREPYAKRLAIMKSGGELR